MDRALSGKTMAVFDPVEQRMCVRVVYDGAAGAGKTTNLRQLGSLFAAQRTTEVASPAELRGRTLYFDWMRIAAGVVCGFPLLCEVIGVPGQVAFTERRRYLLARADVVIYVCESTTEGAARALDALRTIEEIGRATGNRPPLVIQGNKQDQVSALNGPSLLAALGRGDVPVIEAISSEGIGVVDTFVSGVRAVARALQLRMARDGLRIPVRLAPAMGQLLAEIVATPIDRDGAAELLLQEASASLVFDRFTSPASPPSALVASPMEGADESSTAVAPLPNADVPTGFIWPAHTGRVTLRRLAQNGALSQSIRVGSKPAVLAIEGHVLSTSSASHFTDLESARTALVRAARERTQLGALLVNDTVLVVQPSSDGSCWLWTVTPSLEPITEWLDGRENHRRLDSLAAAFVQAIATSLRHGLTLGSSLHEFGIQSGVVRYAGPLCAGEQPKPAAMNLLFRACAELAELGVEIENFVSIVERELPRALDSRALASFLITSVPETAWCATTHDSVSRMVTRLLKAHDRAGHLSHRLLSGPSSVESISR